MISSSVAPRQGAPAAQGGRILLLCALASALAGAGCSQSKSAGTVTGKVTLNGQPVSGLVVFTATNGKEASAPTGPSGEYVLNAPPPGLVKVSVQAPPGALGTGGPAPILPGEGEKLPGPKPPTMGVAPPARYATPDSGLTFEVKGGKQTYDISLTP